MHPCVPKLLLICSRYSTDFDTADKLYFEELSYEVSLNCLEAYFQSGLQRVHNMLWDILPRESSARSLLTPRFLSTACHGHI